MKRLPSSLAARLMRRIRRIPRPTLPGAGFLAVTFAFGIGGTTSMDRSVLLVFGLFLSATLASLVLPILNLRGVVFERLPLPDVHAGEPFSAGGLIHREGGGRDRFAVVVADGVGGPWIRPGHALAIRVTGEPAPIRYRVRIKERGLHRVETVELATRYPFGLFEYRVRRTEVSEVLVYPRVGGFRHDPLPMSIFARAMTSTETVHEKGQEEFRNLREYRPGDNPRLISWKATARFGELMVKELEDDLTKRVTIFLESRLPPNPRSRDRLRLERAISFAATLVRELARRRYRIAVYALSPGPTRVSAGRGGRRLSRVMQTLAMLEPATDADLGSLIRVAPPETFAATLPVVVVPTMDPSRLHASIRHLPFRRRPMVFRADGAWERSLFGYHDDQFAELHGG